MGKSKMNCEKQVKDSCKWLAPLYENKAKGTVFVLRSFLDSQYCCHVGIRSGNAH